MADEITLEELNAPVDWVNNAWLNMSKEKVEEFHKKGIWSLFKNLDYHVWDGFKTPEEKEIILRTEKAEWAFQQLQFREKIIPTIPELVYKLFVKHRGQPQMVKESLKEISEFIEYFELKTEFNAAYLESQLRYRAERLGNPVG